METVKTELQTEAFEGFIPAGFQKATEQSRVLTNSYKPSNVATVVSSLSSHVGSGSSSPQGFITAFISGPASRTNIRPLPKLNQLQGLITPSQQMILPKPTCLPQKQLLPSTPTKSGYVTNQSMLTSPSLPSPVNTWQGSSPYPRKRIPDSDNEFDSKRRRTPNRGGPEKGGKGLRHFSMKVCEKVQQKGITSYNEVADELVREFSEQALEDISLGDQPYDQKNIRRRVYDALNVLMAMSIISKEKKEIKWVGLPTNSAQECQHLEDQKRERLERIHQKQKQLQELIVQQIAFKNLVERNKQIEKRVGPPQTNACIHLPFIIVNTSKKTVIDCSISCDKSEYLFNFDEAFEINDDIEVLKRMGLSFGLEKGECDEKSLRTARDMVPKNLEAYILQMANKTYGDINLIEVDRSHMAEEPTSPLSSRTSEIVSGSAAGAVSTSRMSLLLRHARAASVAVSSTARIDPPSPLEHDDHMAYEESEDEEDDDDDSDLC